MITALLSVLLLADANAVQPTPADASAPAMQAAEAPKEERKICKREQVTGSNRTKKLCMTASQWKAYESGVSWSDEASKGKAGSTGY